MKKQIKAKWLKALRSGKYKQGKCALRSKNDKYCCLGVLCDLAVKNGVKLKVELDEENYRYDESNGFLPDKVRVWAGLDMVDPTAIVDGNEERNLSELNDAGETFDTIADVIEKGL